MTNSLSDLTQQMLDFARQAGADTADAIAVDGTSISIDVRAGALEHAERSEGIDVGLRVLIGQRQAIVSSSDAKPDTLRTMAERAVAMAKEAPEDPHAGLADGAQLTTDTDCTSLEGPSLIPQNCKTLPPAQKLRHLRMATFRKCNLHQQLTAVGASILRQQMAFQAATRDPKTRFLVLRFRVAETRWSATMISIAAFIIAICAMRQTLAGSQRPAQLNAQVRASLKQVITQFCLTSGFQAA
jgi:hypothetical protein